MRQGDSVILLVCDADQLTGSGHVMRQITLGAQLKKLGYRPTLLCHSIPDTLIRRAEDFGLSVIQRKTKSDSKGLLNEVFHFQANGVVFDGYEFKLANLPSFLKNCLVVIVDDNGDFADIPCHIVVNQNIYAASIKYSQDPTFTEFLMGPAWSLIRPEITEIRNKNSQRRRQGIFISIGGTDHRELTPTIRKLLGEITDEPIISTSGLLTPTIMSPQKVAEELWHSKIGVLACGTTTLEAICVDLPFVGLITADNQERVGKSLQENGIAEIIDCRHTFPSTELIDSFTRLLEGPAKEHRKTASVVDGSGSSRVADRIDRRLRAISH